MTHLIIATCLAASFAAQGPTFGYRSCTLTTRGGLEFRDPAACQAFLHAMPRPPVPADRVVFTFCATTRAADQPA